jgi:hypothetical protein
MKTDWEFYLDVIKNDLYEIGLLLNRSQGAICGLEGQLIMYEEGLITKDIKLMKENLNNIESLLGKSNELILEIEKQFEIK